METVSVEIIIGYFITGIIWGSTNALMEVGSKVKAKEEEEISNALCAGVKMFTNLAFLLPFLAN